MNQTIDWLAAQKAINLKTIVHKLIGQFERGISYFSLVGDTPFLDTEQFAWTQNLESDWLKIRQELDLILSNINAIPNFQDISQEQYAITRDDRWKTYFLYAYGHKVEQNCQQCPNTTSSIEAIPGMKTAFFSILLPHKHIPEHRGPYKGVLRYHLGLIVPKPNHSCRIRVGNAVGHWSEGKSLIFDDSYQHEAWNNSDDVRVVLFVDFIRPMSFPFSLLNRLAIELISWLPLVKDGLKRQQKWHESLKKPAKVSSSSPNNNTPQST